METLLDIRDLATYYNVSTKTVRRWAAAGDLPPAIRCGPRLLRWRLSDIINQQEGTTHDHRHATTTASR